jgi:hypothetical protein
MEHLGIAAQVREDRVVDADGQRLRPAGREDDRIAAAYLGQQFVGLQAQSRDLLVAPFRMAAFFSGALAAVFSPVALGGVGGFTGRTSFSANGVCSAGIGVPNRWAHDRRGPAGNVRSHNDKSG